MKYLKLFEGLNTHEIPNVLEITDSIKDILVELEDSGFIISLNSYFNNAFQLLKVNNDEYTLYIGIEGRTTFVIDDIKDRVAMIHLYRSLWKTSHRLRKKSRSISCRPEQYDFAW